MEPHRRTRFTIIDVETTGFSARTDGVVEVACVIVQQGEITSTWSSLVHPGRTIPAYASAIHGIYDHDVIGAPNIADLESTLRRLCQGSVLVAHNAGFDRSFLPMLASAEWLCTVGLARRAFPRAPNHKNQTLRAYLNLDRDDRFRHLESHRALADALVTAGILLRCIERLNRVVQPRREGGARPPLPSSARFAIAR